MTCSLLSCISFFIVLISLASILFFLKDPECFLATVVAAGICLVLLAFIVGLSWGVYKIGTGSCESSSSYVSKENKQNSQISEIDKQIQKLQNQKQELEKKLSETK